MIYNFVKYFLIYIKINVEKKKKICNVQFKKFLFRQLIGRREINTLRKVKIFGRAKAE